MAITDEEQRAATTTSWPLNGAEGAGAIAPAGGAPPVAQDDDLLDQPMTLQEHLAELRDRLIRTVIGVAVGMVAGFFGAQYVIDYFFRVLKKAAPDAELIYSSPTEPIVVFFKIAFYLGVAVAMPIIVYQFIRFLAPGLTKREKRYVYLLMPFVIVFFVLGVLFSSLVAIPNMMHFLLNFGDPRLKKLIRIEEMLGFFSNLSLWTGIVFEMPLVMFMLATLNIAPYHVLRNMRKYAAVGLMILAAVITPTPDPLNMLIVWAPMYLLFELGLILARFARPRQAR
jgi:sec-independent protein translocase protein TatC